ncbi:hypothetical protein Bhyg_05283 [Pseudolycoriella hygida]|uniref:Uncharacterized protein n=1 Tax=Pseudolycoriella hygida TaxID=35572 RepID=A0A9Q0NGW7_9DIPT|nr:hypothetical protein Bhyg_05283 [Pseudolycoriella hygida]
MCKFEEDIEETSELVVNYLGPLLESNGYTLEDLPNELKRLTAKYYLIFSRGEEPLDNLEKMISDYELIQNNQRVTNDDLREYVDHFIELNAAKSKKNLKKFVTSILDSFDFHLEIVAPRDAVSFLLYQKAYPDIVEIISLMVVKHYDAYLKERAKAQGQADHVNGNYDDFDLTANVRNFVASNGRFEFIKLWIHLLDPYIPLVDQADISESLLDYLDNLKDFLVIESNRFWNFLKGSHFKHTTDSWMETTEEMLTHFLKVIPTDEVCNLVDAVMLNSNDWRAMTNGLKYIFEKQHSHSVINAKEIFEFIWEVPQEEFLGYIDQILAPYQMNTSDLSEEMISIISRTFVRINSDDEEQFLEGDILLFRKAVEKFRDSVMALTPEKSESNHIALETTLQEMVNKYGALVLRIEANLVDLFNGRPIGSTSEREVYKSEISKFTQKLDNFFKTSGKTPCEVFKERALEVVQIIDGLITSTDY